VRSPKVVVFDYGFGNVRSAERALYKVGCDSMISDDLEQARAADGLVVPGVGAFDACLHSLRAASGHTIIADRLAHDAPVFGICVGLQAMFGSGTEHGFVSAGLGYWPGSITKLPHSILPQIGWNTVAPPIDSDLFAETTGERFYFVNSYAAQDWSDEGPRGTGNVTWAEYGAPFVAAVEQGSLVATQFHPEKSGEAGLQLLQNWKDTLS
jgi:glutamine amidotransferase